MTFDELLEKLTANALQVDASNSWPFEQLEWLAEAGVMQWFVPNEYGGLDVSPRELTKGYQALSRACLTTCFALTQRNGACQRIAGSKNEELKQQLLPQLATGQLFATVGISHLTTSRQHISQPAVQVEIEDANFVLNGMIPWVTGSSAADFIVTGGTCEDGKQALIAMPTNLPGITVQPKAELMALTVSETSSVNLDNVKIPNHYLLAGPVENVMSQGSGGGAGSLTTSTLALGLAERSLALIQNEAAKRDGLAAITEAFQQDVSALQSDIYAALNVEKNGDEGLSPTAIRQKSNSLALRITQAALTVTKGAGFSKGHPAELAVREAMFFLVWSCPQIVVDGVLSELICRDGF